MIPAYHTAILKHGPANPTDKAVLGAIASHINKPGEVAYPSYKTIARHTSFCRRAVINAVKRLEADGFITITRRPGQGIRADTNQYALNEAWLNGASSAPLKALNGERDAPFNQALVNDDHYVGERRAPMNGERRALLNGERRAPKYSIPKSSIPKSSKEAAAAAGHNGNGTAAAGAAVAALLIFKQKGLAASPTVKMLAAKPWATPEHLPGYIDAWLAEAKTRQKQRVGKGEKLEIANWRAYAVRIMDEDGQLPARDDGTIDLEARKAWQRVTTAVAQHGATDEAVEHIRAWAEGDGAKLAKIAEAFGLARVSRAVGNRSISETCAAFETYYRQAVTTGKVAVLGGQ